MRDNTRGRRGSSSRGRSSSSSRGRTSLSPSFNPHRHPPPSSASRTTTSGGSRLPALLHAVSPALFPGEVVLVPRENVVRIAADRLRSSERLVLCEQFTVTGDCPAMMDECPFLHARDVASARRLHPHDVHAHPPEVWADVATAPYQLYPAAAFGDVPVQAVASKDGAAPVNVMLTDCLVTRAIPAGVVIPHDVLLSAPQCGHWTNKGRCNFGAACQFLHVAYGPAGVITHRLHVDLDS